MPLDRLLAEFPAAELETLVATRRDLHRHPEVAFEEHRTAGVVADDGVGGARILLRADMDALPLQEASAEPYASTIPGRMHACGHDGHVAMALAVARRLAAKKPGAPMRFLFQPAE